MDRTKIEENLHEAREALGRAVEIASPEVREILLNEVLRKIEQAEAEILPKPFVL